MSRQTRDRPPEFSARGGWASVSVFQMTETELTLPASRSRGAQPRESVGIFPNCPSEGCTDLHFHHEIKFLLLKSTECLKIFACFKIVENSTSLFLQFALLRSVVVIFRTCQPFSVQLGHEDCSQQGNLPLLHFRGGGP